MRHAVRVEREDQRIAALLDRLEFGCNVHALRSGFPGYGAGGNLPETAS
jgi:hypothetical protein